MGVCLTMNRNNESKLYREDNATSLRSLWRFFEQLTAVIDAESVSYDGSKYSLTVSRLFSFCRRRMMTTATRSEPRKKLFFIDSRVSRRS